MNGSFQDLCLRMSRSFKSIPIKWTSIFIDAETYESDSTTTCGDIWATECLTFSDNNMFSYPKLIRDLHRYNDIVSARVERSLFGPRLVVVTRYMS